MTKAQMKALDKLSKVLKPCGPPIKIKINIPQQWGTFKPNTIVWFIYENIMIGGEPLKEPWMVRKGKVQYNLGQPYHTIQISDCGTVAGVDENDMFRTKKAAQAECQKRNKS